MSAYVISEVEIRDELLAARYRDLAAASIAAYGGTYPARGAKPVVAEGEFPAAWRAVVVEFPKYAADRGVVLLERVRRGAEDP